MKLSCVILTMGNRPAELDRAIASTATLRADGGDLVVVGNGADLPPVPDGVMTLRLPENVGVAILAVRPWAVRFLACFVRSGVWRHSCVGHAQSLAVAQPFDFTSIRVGSIKADW